MARLIPFVLLAILAHPAGAGGITAPLGLPEEHRTPSPGNTTYHLDPAHGDDANSGLARKSAWRTFARLNQLRLAPGDRVEVVAPGSFDQTLRLTGAGTAEAPVEIRFAPGRYDFHPDQAFRNRYQISNTNDDPEGRKAVGILLAGARHFRISGSGASICYRGKMIEVCIDGSEDISISGLSFDYHRPTVSEFQVETIGDDHVDLRIHQDSTYKIENGSLTWLGEGWSETGGLGQDLDPVTNRVHRVVDPLKNLRFEEIAPFQVRGRGKHRLNPGHIYQLRNPHRDCAGVFTRGSNNITWKNVHFRFLHGMGLVNQFSENLTFDTVTIAPDELSGRTTSAWADGIHVSGCRGKVLVKDCVFSGAHDDAINVHGTYLQVVERLPGRQIKVRFMHAQTFGFPAFHPGDEVEFVHWDSMASYGTNRVTEARLLNPKEILLTLERPVPDDFREKDVLENITWTPEVEIRGCKVMRIPTRGFLITTRRPVLVEDNEFLSTHMSAILIGADAQGWFESGAVRDLTIRRNRFVRCGEPVVSINPRNTVPNNAMHRNIRIEENEFVLRGDTSVHARSTRGLRVTGNTIRAGELLDAARSVRTSDCADVEIGQDMKLALQAYTFRDRSFVETVEAGKRLGITHLEMYGGQKLGGDLEGTTDFMTITPDTTRKLKKFLDDSGVQVVSYGVTNPNDEDQWNRLANFAHAIGIKTIQVEISPDRQKFDLAEKMAEKHDLTIAIHNHSQKFGEPAGVLAQLNGRGPRIGAGSDIGHWMRRGVVPLEGVRTLKGKFVTLHLVDVEKIVTDGKSRDVPYGTGAGNLQAVLDELKSQGFKGYVTCEYEHMSPTLEKEVGECADWFRKYQAGTL